MHLFSTFIIPLPHCMPGTFYNFHVTVNLSELYSFLQFFCLSFVSFHVISLFFCGHVIFSSPLFHVWSINSYIFLFSINPLLFVSFPYIIIQILSLLLLISFLSVITLPHLFQVKFIKAISTTCIPNFPDRNLPAIFVYFEGQMKKQFIGAAEFGKDKITLEGESLVMWWSQS